MEEEVEEGEEGEEGEEREEGEEGEEGEKRGKSKEIVKLAGTTSILTCGLLRININHDEHVQRCFINIFLFLSSSSSSSSSSIFF